MLEADMNVVFNKVHVKWNCVIFFLPLASTTTLFNE